MLVQIKNKVTKEKILANLIKAEAAERIKQD